MDDCKSSRAKMGFKKRSKTRANKNIVRISYNPNKDKQKTRKALRDKLKEQAQQRKPVESRCSETETSLHIGSINVNGIDLEAAWAVSELLREREFDVSCTYLNTKGKG